MLWSCITKSGGFSFKFASGLGSGSGSGSSTATKGLRMMGSSGWGPELEDRLSSAAFSGIGSRISGPSSEPELRVSRSSGEAGTSSLLDIDVDRTGSRSEALSLSSLSSSSLSISGLKSAFSSSTSTSCFPLSSSGSASASVEACESCKGKNKILGKYLIYRNI
jgi:hypothetical protein